MAGGAGGPRGCRDRPRDADASVARPAGASTWRGHCLDALRGDSGAADRLGDLDRLPATLQAWFVARRRPGGAVVPPARTRPRSAHLPPGRRDLSRIATARRRGSFALTVRAAADVVASTAGAERRRRRDALTRERWRRSGQQQTTSRVDPYYAGDAARHAGAATYAAEMDRLTDRQTDRWLGGRGSRVGQAQPSPTTRPTAAGAPRRSALATGQATTATALLRQGSSSGPRARPPARGHRRRDTVTHPTAHTVRTGATRTSRRSTSSPQVSSSLSRRRRTTSRPTTPITTR